MKNRLNRLIEPNMVAYYMVLLCFAIISAIRKDYILAGCELGVFILLVVLHTLSRKRKKQELETFAKKMISTTGEANSTEVPMPMLMIRPGDGVILWNNELFAKATGYQEKADRQTINNFVPKFTSDWLLSGKTEYPFDVDIGKKRYRISGTIFRSNDKNRTVLAMLYFNDLTELYQIRDEYIRSRPVTAIFLVDNYEELTKNLQEGAISALNAQIDDCIARWCENYHGLLRRLERNRYFLIFEQRYLADAEAGKFSVLEDIHHVVNSVGVQASISIGLGVESETFAQGFEYASLSLEMALSRGGNQAVLKNRYEFSFYGGMEHENISRTRVRSRVKAGTLADLIAQSEHVFVMGHKNADMDAFGAAMGIACICRKKAKRCSIVMDAEQNAVGPLLEQVKLVPEYAGMILSKDEALMHCNSRSLLVVVDTNRPDQVESLPLLEAIGKVCIIDHHRRAADYIENVALNFHDTSASSASELVTELLQYTVEAEDVLKIEAMGLLAGIFLDTKSFQIRTEDRTFEAAAFLKKVGADTIEVKKLLQSDFQNTMAKYQIIKNARLYRQEIAISVQNAPTTRVMAAQAADELLNISGITASFVMYPQGSEVIISGRSIGNVNVQLILEPLGGGGNAATAGAQMSNTDIQEAQDKLLEQIDQFYELKEETQKRKKGQE